MQTLIEFQAALLPVVEKIRSERHALNDPSLYGLNFEPADNAGKLLVRAKEFLASAEYEEMLDHLSINPLEAAFLVDRLNLSTQFAISHDLEQAFHQEKMALIREWKSVREKGSLQEVGEAFQVLLSKFMEIAAREDKDLPVLLPRKFTREELRAVYTHGHPLLTMVSTITGEKDEATLEETIERELQEQEAYGAKLSSGHYHRDRMVEFIVGLKDVFAHPEWYISDDEEEEDEDAPVEGAE